MLGEVRGYSVWRCGRCQSLFVPRMVEASDEEYLAFYRVGERYHTEWMRRQGYLTYRERFEHDHTLGLGRMGRIFARMPCGPLLDIGCANGGFLLAAADYGYAAMGIDANASMMRYVAEEHGLLAAPCTFPGDRLWRAWVGQFRVVTMHDVLEHIRPFSAALAASWQLLLPGGLLVVDTPDATSDEALLLGCEWHHVKPEEHPVLFGQELLRALLDRAGFAVVKVEQPISGKMVFYATKRSTERKGV